MKTTLLTCCAIGTLAICGDVGRAEAQRSEVRDQSGRIEHQANRPLPILRVYGRHDSGPCSAFLRDYNSGGEFRTALDARYDVRFYDVAQPIPFTAAKLHSVRTLPAFLPCDTISRVEGYRGPAELLTALGLEERRDESGESRADGPGANTTTGEESSSPALDALRSDVAALQAALQQSTTQADEQRRTIDAALARHGLTLQQFGELIRSDPTGEQLAQVRAALADLQARLTVAPLNPQTAPPAAGPTSPLPPEGPGAEPAARPSSPGAPASPLLRFGPFALTAAELALLVFGSVTTSGTGLLAYKLGGAALRRIAGRIFSRRSTIATPGEAGSRPPPAPPAPQTNFAAYPVDQFSEAYQYATRELVKRYPGSVGALEHLESLIQQFLTGREATKGR